MKKTERTFAQMDYIFHSPNQMPKSNEDTSCVSEGLCSINPIITSLQEVILLYLRELAFYLLELENMGVCNEKIKQSLMTALSVVVSDVLLSQEQFEEITHPLMESISEAKRVYIKVCDERNIKPNMIKPFLKHNRKLTLSSALMIGEKHLLKKNTNPDTEQKNLNEIVLLLLRSIYMRLHELKEFGKEPEGTYTALLKLLNTMNPENNSKEQIKETIEDLSGVFFEIMAQLHQVKSETYGTPEQTEVSCSTQPGKAILVSGSNLRELENVLKAAEGTTIDIYTHGLEMLIAHTFPKFKQYKNLKGHFGRGGKHTFFEFTTFPGPILVTKHSFPAMGSFYHGSLFTTDLAGPKGVIKITHDNYEPLISAAHYSRGFHSGKEMPSVNAGFIESEIEEMANGILKKLETKEIKHLFIIGLLNIANNEADYFKQFLKILPKDCYAISLSHEHSDENIYHIKSFFNCALIHKIFTILSQRTSLKDLPITIFITNCNKHTIANILNLKKIGIHDIYMSKCSPMLLNPVLVKTMEEIFEIKEFAHPEQDLKRSL